VRIRRRAYIFFAFAHRVCTALRAFSWRSFGLNFAAEALPPRLPIFRNARFSMALSRFIQYLIVLAGEYAEAFLLCSCR
jgi:hypothetical protein